MLKKYGLQHCKKCLISVLIPALVIVVLISMTAASEKTIEGDNPAEAKDVSHQTSIRFEEVTQKAGITYCGSSWGAAWGNFNGDPYPDLWASGHSPNHLYLNRGNGTFQNFASRTVYHGRMVDRHGAAWADIDNDGDQDLAQFVGAQRGLGQGANFMFRNKKGQLYDQAVELGLADAKGRGRTPLWLDFDRDGRLDLLINNASRHDAPSAIYLNRTNRFQKIALPKVRVNEYAQIANLNNGPKLHLLFGNPFPAIIYSQGDRTFVNIVKTFNLSLRPSTDSAIADFDNDLFSDIFVTYGALGSGVEFITSRKIAARLISNWRNRAISFAAGEKVTIDVFPQNSEWWHPEIIFLGLSGKHPTDFPIILSARDTDVHYTYPKKFGDGLFLSYNPNSKLWTVGLRSSKGGDRINLIIESSAPIKQLKAIGFELQPPEFESHIFWNKKGVFSAPESKTFPLTNSYCVGAGDFDNDMDVDLYLVCSQRLKNKDNVLLENIGHRKFVPIPNGAGAPGSQLGLGESVALADYDLDGFLDLFVTNGKELPPFNIGPHQLFRNLGNTNHWIEIDLEGVSSNRDAIGARVLLTAGGVTQTRLADNGTHNRSQNFKRIHFGLGKNKIITKLTIIWPNGKSATHTNISVDQVLRISESGVIERLK
ncbi:CRTAC1 family protein [candidate division CSSED10-310 bacterium]|uniref:CRTAC1 family protein n=1 Tax=candidate division CSSED10-310 bacterium TaxID=2855610 RepID=A0ABV6Z4G5_UNCC1